MEPRKSGRVRKQTSKELQSAADIKINSHPSQNPIDATVYSDHFLERRYKEELAWFKNLDFVNMRDTRIEE